MTLAKKSALWILFVVVSLASATFSWRYFTRAFPLLSLDIRMDRQGAVARARDLAASEQLGPPDFHDAASFALDESVQTFVELEGGGKPAFAALLSDREFTPYRWRVRHFKERERREATFSFAPDGTPNGFVEQLPEDAPGAALTESSARTIAESAAARAWRVAFSPFQLVEHSREQRIGGRVDHTFVYERHDRQLSEGRYRLRLVISGDKLTEVTYFLKVPDAFNRRYEHMRSANTAIGAGGGLAFLVLYGVGGIAVGLFFLARQRWVIWRQPLLWGSIVALAQTAATINEWPLTWMQYDTALSTGSFVAQRVAAGATELALNVVLFSLSFMAAESLTRRAFPKHPQLWRIWSGDSGGSRAVLGRTMAGYLLVAVFIAYDVALYFFATKALGWWTPSEALFNPDLLASYAPWISGIAKSFQAGFWEESAFRAIPIAGAALIGERLGNRRAWIIAAFIVQAAVFGAGHAPYPTQPAYARPVELVVPSLAFGLLYLRFGLLPGIVLHFVFDAFWFGMPLFASSAAGTGLQQFIMVAAVLAPLWVVLTRRVKAGRWADLSAVQLNDAWRPEPAVVDRTTMTPPTAATSVALNSLLVRTITIVGTIAAIVWITAVIVRPIERYSLRSTRTDAVTAARAAVTAAQLGSQWRFLAVADQGGGPPDRFVWKTAGRSAYMSLLGNYLSLPGWTVSVRTFEGAIAERAENWTVRLDRDAVVQRLTHELPESRRGTTLDGASARDLAQRTVIERFHANRASLREVSATPSQLPERTDWVITFADGSQSLPRGELRLSVHIAGSEIADASRFVYLPEEWERTERNAEAIASIVRLTGGLVAGAMVFGGAIAAIVSWSRRQFAVRVFLTVCAFLLALNAVRLVNASPAMMAGLSTSQPLNLQIAVLIGSTVVGVGLLSVAMALVAGAVPIWLAAGGGLKSKDAMTIGAALGMLAVTIRATTAFIGSSVPTWPSYVGATSFVPFVAAALNPTVTLLTRLVVLLALVAAVNRMTVAWTRRRVLAGALLWVAGGLLADAGSPQDLLLWGATASALGGVLVTAYILVLRHDASILVPGVAIMTMAGTLREGWSQAYPGALPGAIVAALVSWAVAYSLFGACRLPRPAASLERVGV